jgi:hypothetical protein
MQYVCDSVAKKNSEEGDYRNETKIGISWASALGGLKPCFKLF